MPTVSLFPHVIEDPVRVPKLPGNRGSLAHLLCEQAVNGLAIPVVKEHREVLITAVETTTALLREVLEEVPLTPQHTTWDELDLYVFQSAPENADPPSVGGVMGFYSDRVNDGGPFAPHIELYVLPGFEHRLSALALHELGHFLRSRAVWGLETPNFVYWVFEEGLCEHLVRRKLGLEHVTHGLPLHRHELEILQPQVEASLRHLGEWSLQPPQSVLAYRLGYQVVQRLLDQGHTWASLLTLSLCDTGLVMHEQTKELLQNGA